MAQAARLNLRMQKELKLLLSGPPPGVSFPTLSDDSSASSLTSIDAHLQGPEETVYANGVFKIKIQIPERYPFQPPIVTFATPIYHPNIDNGGRICLDILNLPPKGMWQPSLNVSTVLTSIGLLLSEPNPDDGLMHEASRDYKYNRQAFDQNARSMTEKYAGAGENESATSSHGTQPNTGQSTAQTRMEVSAPSISITEHGKLSLESLGSSSNVGDSGKQIHKVPTHDYSRNHVKSGQLKEANNDLSKDTGNPGKLQASRNKLSLKVPNAFHRRNVESENTTVPNHCSSLLEIQTTCTDSPEPSLLVHVGNIASNRDEDHIERSCNINVGQEQESLHQSLHRVKTGRNRDSDEKLQSLSLRTVSQLDTTKPQEGLPCSLSTGDNKPSPNKDAIARKGNLSTSIRLKKIGLVGSTRSLGHLGSAQNCLIDEKENLAPFRCLKPPLTDESAASVIISSVVPENGVCCNETGKQAVTVALKKSEMAVKLPLKSLDQQLGNNDNMILHCESPSSPHSKYLHVRNDLTSDKKHQNNEVRDRESSDKFKQLAEGEGLQVPEAVIVLDSEDSEDEIVAARFKLSVAKRCLSRKRKSGF